MVFGKTSFGHLHHFANLGSILFETDCDSLAHRSSSWSTTQSTHQDHQQENGQWVLVSFGPLLLMFGHLFFLRWTWMWSWVVGSGATPPLATTDPRWNPTSTCLGTTGRCSFCDKGIPGYDHIKQIQVFSHLEKKKLQVCYYICYM